MALPRHQCPCLSLGCGMLHVTAIMAMPPFNPIIKVLSRRQVRRCCMTQPSDVVDQYAPFSKKYDDNAIDFDDGDRGLQAQRQPMSYVNQCWMTMIMMPSTLDNDVTVRVGMKNDV